MVVLGHTLQGPLSENMARYAIYSFHMPLFLAINGYLLKSDTLYSLRLGELLVKYCRRMLLPFMVAFVVYFMIVNAGRLPDLSMGEIAFQLLYPAYHLWYIPALMLMILAVYLFNSVGIKAGVPLVIAFFASLVWFYFFPDNLSLNSPIPGNRALSLMGDKRVYVYFCFFYLGFYLRNHTGRSGIFNRTLPKAGLFGAGILLILGFYSPPSPLRQFVFLLFNALLIIFFHERMSNRPFGAGGRFLEIFGKNPLPFYLWHALPVFLFNRAIFKDVHVFYLSIVAFLVVMVIIDRVFSENAWYKIFFSGASKRHAGGGI